METHLPVQAERSKHEGHESGQGLDDAVLQRAELGEAKKVSPMREGFLEDQPERPSVLSLGALLQNIHDLVACSAQGYPKFE